MHLPVLKGVHIACTQFYLLAALYFSSDTRTCALPITHKDEALIKFKSFFYFEHKDTPVAEAEQVSMYIL